MQKLLKLLTPSTFHMQFFIFLNSKRQPLPNACICVICEKFAIPYDASSGRKLGSDRSGLWWLHACFFIIFLQVISFKDDLNHKGAAWTNGNVFPIKHIINVNLKPVSTGTWICEDLGIRVEGHVFNFDLIISRHF